MLLAELRAAGVLDLFRASVDSSHLRAMKGASVHRPVPGGPRQDRQQAPRDRRDPRYPAGRHADRRQPQRRDPVDPADPSCPADPRQTRPTAALPEARLYADCGYDHDSYRDQVRRFEITPHIARRGTDHGSGSGVHRWAVEGAIALLHWFRRLLIRWEIRGDIHQAFITLGCAVICWRRLKTAL